MNGSQRVAVLVEDEVHIRRFVRLALEAENWQVFEAITIAQGLVHCGTRSPDLVILDLGLPDGDGKLLLADLRAWSQVPLIVLSARSDEAEKIAALNSGADDYLTKPFGIGELMARVGVVTRRSKLTAASATARFGDVEVDLDAANVRKNGHQVHLTPIEYRLLSRLIAHAGKALTHRQLLRDVWGPTHVDDHHYLRVYMSSLRAKLEDDPAQPKHLLTITAVGYRLLLS